MADTHANSPAVTGHKLLERYWELGHVADLQAAIAHWDQAVAEAPPGSSDRPNSLSTLGLALRERYARAGDTSDIDRAIASWQEALNLTAPDSAGRPEVLEALTRALRERYERAADLRDVDRAIATCTEAVGLTPRDSPDRADRLVTLGRALGDRFARTADLPDIKLAIEVYQEAVERSDADSVQEATRLECLAGALIELYRRTAALRDLHSAITSLERSLASTPHDALPRSRRLLTLAGALTAKHARTHDEHDLTSALDFYHQSCESGQELVERLTLPSDDLTAVSGPELRSWQHPARLLRYWQDRQRPLEDLLDFDWRAGTTIVVPTLPSPDLSHSRTVATEDLCAIASIEEAIASAKAPRSRVRIALTDETSPSIQQQNLFLICSVKRNPLTGAVLEHPKTRSILSCSFVERRLDGPDGLAQWGINFEGEMLLSPSYDQELALKAEGKIPQHGPVDDYALIAKLPNPWGSRTTVMILAGTRAFGTWGAAEYLRSHAAELHHRTTNRYFAVIVRVRMENLLISAEQTPYLRTAGRVHKVTKRPARLS